MMQYVSTVGGIQGAHQYPASGANSLPYRPMTFIPFIPWKLEPFVAPSTVVTLKTNISLVETQTGSPTGISARLIPAQKSIELVRISADISIRPKYKRSTVVAAIVRP